MTELTPQMMEIIRTYNAGSVATVNKQGMPCVSPKATFVIINSRQIAFGNIRSPQTLENLSHQSELEVLFTDILKRIAVRVRGNAEIVDKDSAGIDHITAEFEKYWQPYLHLIDRFVVIDISSAKLVTSPGYDIGLSAEEMQQMNFEKLKATL